MPKRDNYLAHYYEKATIDQLADEYKQKGYNVQREARVDKYRVDLLAEKDGQKVYVEVVRKRVAGEVRRRIEALEELIRKQPNSRLIVVKERYSDEKQIEFNKEILSLEEKNLEMKERLFKAKKFLKPT